jgi:hypothetical protein
VLEHGALIVSTRATEVRQKLAAHYHELGVLLFGLLVAREQPLNFNNGLSSSFLCRNYSVK